jgi:hypothetical protein
VHVRPGESASVSFAVVSDVTLEVCIAQFWSSIGDTAVAVDVSFKGISCGTSEVQARFALPLYSCHRRRPHQYSRMHTPPARAAGAYGAHHCAT